MENKTANILIWIVVLVILVIALLFYKDNNFNDFVRSETNLKTSEFKRDSEIKYSKTNSYKIISQEMNDATFYKEINVKKNTPYKVTCMVKTENVVPEDDKLGVGAQIAIIGTTEKSTSISGTADWQKIEFIFNSKNREKVKVGFRLGGFLGKCTGTAWFSDFTLEEGTLEEDNEWKIGCFIFENTDVIIDGKEIKLSMTDSDISDMISTIQRYDKIIKEASKGKMTSKSEIYRVKSPITRLSYDDEYGYFVSSEDVENLIDAKVKEKEYDHIFVIVKLGNENYFNDIEINDWIGLGSMDYYGIGFSNIRLPNSSNSYVYKYDTRVNTFPEGVLLHEYLHSLERTAIEYGYEIPALHDYEKYGYKNEGVAALKDWYTDYMNKSIKTGSGLIGLPEEVYKIKPVKNSNFEYSYSLNDLKDPENIFEVIGQLFKNVSRNIKQMFNRDNVSQNVEIKTTTN